MACLLPSEIARLVLGYLKEEKCHETYNRFLDECIHLEEYSRLMKGGYVYSTRVEGRTLKDILDQDAPRKMEEEKQEHNYRLLDKYEQMFEDVSKVKERSSSCQTEAMREYRSRLSSSLQSHTAMTDIDSEFEPSSSPSNSSNTSYILPQGSQDMMAFLNGRWRVASTPSHHCTADLNENSVRKLFSSRETPSLVSSCETSPVSLDRIHVVPHPADHSSQTERPTGKSSERQDHHLPDNACLTPDRSDITAVMESGMTAIAGQSQNKTPTSVVSSVPTESDGITTLLSRDRAGENQCKAQTETTSALDCHSNLGNSGFLCLPDLLNTQDSMDPTTPVKNSLTAQTSNFLRTPKRKCPAPKRRSTGPPPADGKPTTGLIEDSTDSGGFAVPLPLIQGLISCKKLEEKLALHINKGVQSTKHAAQKKAPTSSAKDDQIKNSSDTVKNSSEKQTDSLDALANPLSPEYVNRIIDMSTLTNEAVTQIIDSVRADPEFGDLLQLFDTECTDNSRISTEHGTPSKQQTPGPVLDETRPFSIVNMSASRDNHPDIPPPEMDITKAHGENESVDDIEMPEADREDVVLPLNPPHEADREDVVLHETWLHVTKPGFSIKKPRGRCSNVPLNVC